MNARIGDSNRSHRREIIFGNRIARNGQLDGIFDERALSLIERSSCYICYEPV
jgi:hypothetical protein